MKSVLSALALFLLFCQLSPALPASDTSFAGRTMGTSYSVTCGKRPEPSVAAGVASLLARLDGLLSTYRADSEVSRFNACHSSEWFPVSVDTATVVETAHSVSRLTEGAFDITVDPLVRLWGFGPHRGTGCIPSTDAVAKARRHVGWRKLEVRLDPPALRKIDPELTVDLSGVAKGYAADAVAGLLDQAGMQSYLIAVGGELKARGNSPLGRPWHVGIEEPLDRTSAVHCAVELQSCALSTSGDYRNFFISNEHRYSHVLDPRTGSPVGDELASVSVMGSRGAYADALATALMVLGPNAGYALALKNDFSCLFLLRTKNGIAEKPTPKFEKQRVKK